MYDRNKKKEPGLLDFTPAEYVIIGAIIIVILVMVFFVIT